MKIDAKNLNFESLNAKIKGCKENEIVLNNVLGQRYIGSGVTGKHIVINGIPGNALGAYLDGCDIEVNGNAQDALGDTMNSGSIIVNGSCGDTVGYGMRGGKIFIKGYAGYRVGIHVKQYAENIPIIVVGGTCGAYLGEYLAGGIIVVLGIGCENQQCVGDFTATGMHGGKIYIRTNILPNDLPPQVEANKVNDKTELKPIISEFCKLFKYDEDKLINGNYFVLTPSTSKIYKTMYCNRPV